MIMDLVFIERFILGDLLGDRVGGGFKGGDVLDLSFLLICKLIEWVKVKKNFYIL